MKFRLQVVLIAALALILTGCLGGMSSVATSGAGSNAAVKGNNVSVGENPLQGLELDLAFMDVTAGMLRTNHILLNMPISRNATWPSKLPLEGKSDKYKDAMDDELANNFSFFKYYGEMSWSDLSSMNSAKERPIIEAGEYIARNIMHQRNVIVEDELENDSKCTEFTRPLEDVILHNVIKNEGKSWIQSSVSSECLRDVQARGKLYSGFEEAFVSLLDAGYVGKYKDARNEYRVQSEKLSDLKLKKKRLEKEKETSQDSENSREGKIKDLKNKIQAVEKDIAVQEKKRDNAQQAYKDLLERAQKSIVVTPEKVELAKNIYEVVEIVESNLSKATGAIPAVMGKAVWDVSYMAKNAGNLQKVIPVFVSEAQSKLGVSNKAKATEIATKRLELITSRSVTFLPDLVNISCAAYQQYDLYEPKVSYLEKLIEEGGGFEEEDGFFSF